MFLVTPASRQSSVQPTLLHIVSAAPLCVSFCVFVCFCVSLLPQSAVPPSLLHISKSLSCSFVFVFLGVFVCLSVCICVFVCLSVCVFLCLRVFVCVFLCFPPSPVSSASHPVTYFKECQLLLWSDRVPPSPSYLRGPWCTQSTCLQHHSYKTTVFDTATDAHVLKTLPSFKLPAGLQFEAAAVVNHLLVQTQSCSCIYVSLTFYTIGCFVCFDAGHIGWHGCIGGRGGVL